MHTLGLTIAAPPDTWCRQEVGPALSGPGDDPQHGGSRRFALCSCPECVTDKVCPQLMSVFVACRTAFAGATLRGMDETIGARIQRIANGRRRPNGEPLPTGAGLAEYLGVTYEALRSWTVGESAPRRARLPGIAQKLGVSVKELVFGETQPAPELSPDALAIAEAFEALPATDPVSIEVRHRLYTSIVEMLRRRDTSPAATPTQRPAETPTESPRQRS